MYKPRKGNLFYSLIFVVLSSKKLNLFFTCQRFFTEINQRNKQRIHRNHRLFTVYITIRGDSILAKVRVKANGNKKNLETKIKRCITVVADHSYVK